MKEEKRVTKKHFEYYCKRVDYWLHQFGTTDWTLYFEQEEMNCAARLRYDYSSRAATFLLPFTRSEVNRASFDESALHEVVHLMLAPLDMLGCRRFVSEAELDGAYEGTTCRITKVIASLRKK